MLTKIFYLLVIVAIASHEIVCKIRRNRLHSNDSFTFSRKDDQLKKNEYVPLNSFTLNLLYNKNQPNNAISSEKSSLWLKPKKKGTQMKKKTEGGPIVKEHSSTKLVNVHRTAPNEGTTPKVESYFIKHSLCTR